MRHQALAVAERNLRVARVFVIGPLEPLRGADALAHLRQFEESGGRACLVSSLRTELTQAQEVPFGRLQRYETLQHDQAILLATSLDEVFQSAFVGFECKLAV